VGKAALEGLQGIKRIDKGFHNAKEISEAMLSEQLVYASPVFAVSHDHK
jgi:hypothetical protein